MIKTNYRFTPSERAEYKELTLKKLNERLYNYEIAEYLGIGETTVKILIDELVQENKITYEEIQTLREGRANIQAKKIQKERAIKIIIDGIDEGLSQKEISENEELSMSQQTVSNIILELKLAGIITQSRIDAGKIKRKAKRKDEKEKSEKPNTDIEIPKSLIDNVLTLLNEGVATKKIRSITSISKEIFDNIVNQLISDNQITIKGIHEAREKREKRNQELVRELLLEGYSIEEIGKQIPYGDRKYAERLVKVVKAANSITDEQIKKAQEDRYIRDRWFIIDLLKAGYNIKEISETEQAKAKGFSYDVINISKNKFLDMGLITEADIKRGISVRKQREKGQSDNHLRPEEEKILRLTNLGFKIEEIAELIGAGRTFVFECKKKLIEAGKLSKLTPSESKKLSARKEEMAQERRAFINKMISFEADIDIETVENHMEYVKSTCKLGETNEKDINLLCNIIPMDERFVTSQNVNFILSQKSRKNEFKVAKVFIHNCREAVSEYDTMLNKLDLAEKAIDDLISKQSAIASAKKRKDLPESPENR